MRRGDGVRPLGRSMQFRRFNDEVVYAGNKSVAVGHQEVGFLKEQAEQNQRKRMRLCAHADFADHLHEMFIVHYKDAYVRPHKHLGKIESAHVIEGMVDLVIFDEEGNVIEVKRMGDYASGRTFYNRLAEPDYHTLLIRSESLVFHEVTNGPFRASDNILAPWAPDDSDPNAVTKYMEKLDLVVASFINQE